MCRKNCTCDGDGCAMGDIHHLSAPQHSMQSSSHTTRKLSEMDKDDLRLALNELKDKYSSGVVSLFHEETCHGFSQSLVNDIVDHAEHIFSGKYLTDNLAIYSSIHAIDVLEIFQELFEDIDDFEHKMDELHLLNKQFTKMENYLISSSMSVDTADVAMDDLVVPQYDVDL